MFSGLSMYPAALSGSGTAPVQTVLNPHSPRTPMSFTSRRTSSHIKPDRPLEPRGISSVDYFKEERPHKPPISALFEKALNFRSASGSSPPQTSPSLPSSGSLPKSPSSPASMRFKVSSLKKSYGQQRSSRTMSSGSGDSSPSMHSPSAPTVPPIPSKEHDDFVPRQESHSPGIVQSNKAQSSPSYPKDASHSADSDRPVSNGNILPEERPITSPSPSARAALSGVSQRTAMEENEIQERFRRDQGKPPSKRRVVIPNGADDGDDDVRLAYDDSDNEVNAATYAADNAEINAEGWVPEVTKPSKPISSPTVVQPRSMDLGRKDSPGGTPPKNPLRQAVEPKGIEQDDSRNMRDINGTQNGGGRLDNQSVDADAKIAEQNRLAAEERQRRERIDLEASRLHAERAEAERVEQQRAEKERLEAERAEKERIEAERIKAERVERDRVEAERAEKKRIEAKRIERDRLETERMKREELEKQKRLARERERQVKEEDRERERQVKEEDRERERRLQEEERERECRVMEEERERVRVQAEQQEIARQRRESIRASMSKGKAQGGLVLQGVGFTELWTDQRGSC